MNVIESSIAEVKLSYSTKVKAADRLKVTCSEDAYKAFLRTWAEDTIEHHESFKMMLLNRANCVLGIVVISVGGLSGTVIDIRQIFQAAINSNSSSIIAAHNHPSGNRQPSDADIKITKKISEAGKILDIKVLDHLILTQDEGYFSFADEGLI